MLLEARDVKKLVAFLQGRKKLQRLTLFKSYSFPTLPAFKKKKKNLVEKKKLQLA